MIRLDCPRCGSNRSHVNVIDEQEPVVVHHICISCDAEWVE